MEEYRHEIEDDIDGSPETASNDLRQVHPPADNITELLNFRVAHLAAVADRSGNAFFVGRFDLRLPEWRILGLIFTHERLVFRELSKLLLMDKGQLSRMVKGLVDRGLIVSEPLETDRRSLVLALTAKGRALHDKALAFARVRNNAAAGALTAAECDEFMRLLDKLITYNKLLWDERTLRQQAPTGNKGEGNG